MLGNPPYQDETVGDNKTKAAAVYNLFMDASQEVGDAALMIHPARFLFNTGSTPKQWDQKMLNSDHFQILNYFPNSSDVFPNTSIKGGVAISLYDSNKTVEPIRHFVVHPELRSIFEKVKLVTQDFSVGSIASIVYAPESYRFNDFMHNENPDVESLLSKGHKYDFKTSVLSKLDGKIFFDNKQTDDSIEILGLAKGKRVFKWINRNYITTPINFNNYKIFVPEANGSGALGEVLSTPLIGQPLIGHTQTFLSIGNFENLQSAENALKYIKSKFARVLLGILKVTQHNPKNTWKYVPLQDFTSNSDIDWSVSIPEIDQQLYKKYGLSPEEIDFIETHVKEME